MQRRLLVLASALALVLAFFSPSSAQVPVAAAQSSLNVQRITGDDHPGVAAAASTSYAPGQPVVFIVATDAHADGLITASSAAGDAAPVLFVHKNSVPAVTASALERLKPEEIVVVGGPVRVSDDVVQSLRPHATNGSVERLSGKDRYSTAAALAMRFSPGVDRVYVASGTGYTDALSGAALAGHEEAPLLLTRSAHLGAAAIAQLERLAPKEIVVLGGSKSVTEPVRDALSNYTDGATRRLSGANRYETAAEIALQMPVDSDHLYAANGTAYSDALIAATLAGGNSQPLVLTKTDGVPAASKSAIEFHAPEVVYAVGTPETIPDQVVDDLRSVGAEPPAPTCQGVPSTDTKFGVSLSPGSRPPAQALDDLDAAFGEVPVLRVFFTGLPGAWDSPRPQAVKDRDMVVSFKAPPDEVIAGTHDAYLRDWFATAPEDQTIFWSYFHEPEVKVKNGLFTEAQYRAAWQHLDELADEACKPNMFPTLILTAWTIDPLSGRDWRDYDPGKDVVEVIAFDPYNKLHDPEATTYTSAEKMLGPLAEVMEQDGRAWGIAEIGSRVVVGDDGSERAAWLTSVGEFLVEHEASFATYFNLTYKGVDFTLDDEPSRAAWSDLVLR